MKLLTALFLLITSIIFSSCCSIDKSRSDDVWNYAIKRKSDLQLGVYVTAQTVNEQFTNESGCREALSLLRCNGITKVYLEVYRGGLVVPYKILKKSISFLIKNDFEVAGGIATVPGPGFGVHQEGPLGWFNWQNKVTRDNLKTVIEKSVPLFERFIIDDFLCTSDTSLESKAAKGNRTWSAYRRDLLTGLCSSLFIKPAKEKNPGIKMIIKFPQWYDRFHLFGYDLETEPGLFDEVWVGTETRGQHTKSFGFVQPYEGFINFRWIASLSGDKTGGAWFDHIDCTGTDFISQAYQSVLAGARELIIFNFDNLLTGHPGHHLLRHDFEKLADLAHVVKNNPVIGPVGYKPPNSDAMGDLYIMDYIGMLGISLIPDSKYPDKAEVIFLPTQAASDSSILKKVLKSVEKGAKIIMTAGFIANANNSKKLAQMAQIKWPLIKTEYMTTHLLSEERIYKINIPLVLDYELITEGAEVLLKTSGSDGKAFLLQNKKGNIVVINTHTFSQKDFDEASELLLCPAESAINDLPEYWTNTIRKSFQRGYEPVLKAESQITYQELSDGSFVVQNYRNDTEDIILKAQENTSFKDLFSGKQITSEGTEIILKMTPNSRFWIKPEN